MTPQHRTRREVLRFTPRFCPHPDGCQHTLREGEGITSRCPRRGTRKIPRAPGIVRRFPCNSCGRTFSFLFLLVDLVWRHNLKGVSERTAQGSRTTPAMKQGLIDRSLRPEEILHERLFPRRVGLPEELSEHDSGTLRFRPGEGAGTYRDKTAIAA